MDTKRLFRGISAKMLEDFRLSSEINHLGNRGTYRESGLKEFLKSGKLPKKYGVGSGEIIGRTKNVSKQSDLIVYDELEGLALIFSDEVQIFPIECVYGVIEVKSSLNKTELLRALENIKSVKQLAPDETAVRENISGLKVTYRRPKPFGIVFAYQLSCNSLNSLEQNLIDWQKENHYRYWPNAIVVLNEGIILHSNSSLSSVYLSESINNYCNTIGIHYRKDTLFRFYSILIGLCSTTTLGNVDLESYFEPAEQIGKYLVENHNRIRRKGENNVYRLSEQSIHKIVNHCQATKKLTERELCLKQFGSIPIGLDDAWLKAKVYLYNPDNLQGIYEDQQPIKIVEGKAFAPPNCMVPCHYITVNDEVYYFPWAYVTNNDLELIEGVTLEDL